MEKRPHECLYLWKSGTVVGEPSGSIATMRYGLRSISGTNSEWNSKVPHMFNNILIPLLFHMDSDMYGSRSDLVVLLCLYGYCRAHVYKTHSFIQNHQYTFRFRFREVSLFESALLKRRVCSALTLVEVLETYLDCFGFLITRVLWRRERCLTWYNPFAICDTWYLASCEIACVLSCGIGNVFELLWTLDNSRFVTSRKVLDWKNHFRYLWNCVFWHFAKQLVCWIATSLLQYLCFVISDNTRRVSYSE